jgi:hypothetical protein
MCNCYDTITIVCHKEEFSAKYNICEQAFSYPQVEALVLTR